MLNNMMKSFSWVPAKLLLVMLAACGGGPGGGSPGDSPTQNFVAIDSGLIRGTQSSGLVTYKGIPYAKPPVGTLRWKATQLPDSWTGVREATTYGANCAQISLDGFKTLLGSEDCLFLNVWAPVRTTTALLPVFVYLHAGGNFSSSGDLDFSRFANAGPVIVVTLNYRLGSFGFLGHANLKAEDPNNSTGNYGILDQIAALKWVQRNIQQFGGDPSRVTLGGYSAGAHDTAVLIASPLAKNLFSAAAVMSHSWFVQPQSVVTNTAAVAVTFLGCDGAADVVACLRSKSTAEVALLPGNGGSGNTDKDPRCASIGCRFNLASVDGYVLPKTPLQIVRDATHNKVPVLIGSTKTEVTTSYKENKLNIQTGSEYLTILSLQFPAAGAAQKIYDLYPPGNYTADFYTAPASAYIIAVGDIHYHCSARSMLNEFASKQTQPVWQYVWAHGPASPYYAGHYTDFPYVFLIDLPATISASEVTLSNSMSKTWLRFIANHDPQSDTLIWPAYDLTTYKFRVWETPELLGSTPVVQSQWRHAQCNLLAQNGFDWEYFP